ncbi:MAG: amino acid adenylation domain-containing protein, partial [Bacteroidota bacterium]
RLVEDLDLPRDLSRSAVFDVLLVLQNNEQSELRFGDVALSVETVEATGVSKFDLTFSFSETADGLLMGLEYNTDLFKSDRIERLAEHLQALLGSVLHNPKAAIGDLNLLPDQEQNMLLHGFNDTEADYPKDKTIVQLFEEQVEKTPDHTAVTFGGHPLSYRELNEQSNQLAHYLRANCQIQSDDIVAIQVERSEWMMVAILGVLKSGAAYLPIGPDLPQARVAFMLKDSRAKALLTDAHTYASAQELKSDLLDLTIEHIEEAIAKNHTSANPERINGSRDLAYIIYTSGSTGMPKGVMIEHYNVVRLLFNDRDLFDFNDTDVWTLFHYFGFDFSVWEIWGALLFGGRVVVVPREIALDPALFADLIIQERVTVLNQVPSTFDQVRLALLQETRRSEHLALRYVIFGGAPLLPASLSVFHEVYPQVRLINMYGITETTVHVTFKEITEVEINAGISNVGKPLPTLCCYILDAQNRLLPIGVAGEICVSGAGLARGYLNNPELTAEKFIPHPFKAGERLYKSGDLGRWLPDGNMEHLGRIDHQLKVRGYRIEAGEIEQALMGHEAVELCVVIGRETEGSIDLVAYLVPQEGTGFPDTAALRTFLSQRLPDYMIPAYFVVMESLPLTGNGKIDRKALPAPDRDQLASGTVYVAPGNAIEVQLVEIWQQVLGREQIGVEDNFFNLGGHSLRALRMVSIISQNMSVEIKLSEIFAQPTIAGLVKSVEALRLRTLLQELSAPIGETTEDHYKIEETW